MIKALLKTTATLFFIVSLNRFGFSQSQFQKDTATIGYYLKYSNKYKANHLDSFIMYADSVHHILKNINYPKGMALYNNMKGNIALRKSDLALANVMFARSLKNAILCGDSSLKYSVMGNIGMVYNRIGKLDSAKIILKKILLYATEKHKLNIQAKAALDLSQSYARSENWNNSLKYSLMSDSIFEVLGDTFYRTYSLNSLAIDYTRIGNYKKSIETYHKGISFGLLKNPKIIVYYYSNLGDLYSRFLLVEDSSIYYLNKAIALSKKYHMSYQLASS